jgi:membrane protein implicated in regulation of membrane protease activity
VLLLGAILLAVFVLPSPWGLIAVASGGILDVAESIALLKWSRRRKAPVGGAALVGSSARVASPTQVRVAGELWEARSADAPLVRGEQVEVTGAEGLILEVSRPSRAPR